MTREAKCTRTTKETKIESCLVLEGSGKADIDTGIGFFDHMLELFAFHSGFDLTVKAEGDLDVCDHHTIEDCGIVLGSLIQQDTIAKSTSSTGFLTLIGENWSTGMVRIANNGGGLVMQAVGVADQIMDRGTIVYTEDHDKKREFLTTGSGRTPLPYVILVNQYTASASEILCAGVQDNQEGIIVGTQTYGKGIIQGFFDIGSDGTMLKLTYQQYYSPQGHKIHGTGITPDYVVELVPDDPTDYQLLKAIEVLKK